MYGFCIYIFEYFLHYALNIPRFYLYFSFIHMYIYYVLCLIWPEQEQHDYIYCNEIQRQRAKKKQQQERIIIKCISILASIYWQCLICEYFCCFVMYTHFDDRTYNEHISLTTPHICPSAMCLCVLCLQMRFESIHDHTWNENKKKLIFVSVVQILFARKVFRSAPMHCNEFILSIKIA